MKLKFTKERSIKRVTRIKFLGAHVCYMCVQVGTRQTPISYYICVANIYVSAGIYTMLDVVWLRAIRIPDLAQKICSLVLFLESAVSQAVAM